MDLSGRFFYSFCPLKQNPQAYSAQTTTTSPQSLIINQIAQSYCKEALSYEHKRQPTEQIKFRRNSPNQISLFYHQSPKCLIISDSIKDILNQLDSTPAINPLKLLETVNFNFTNIAETLYCGIKRMSYGYQYDFVEGELREQTAISNLFDPPEQCVDPAGAVRQYFSGFSKIRPHFELSGGTDSAFVTAIGWQSFEANIASHTVDCSAISQEADERSEVINFLDCFSHQNYQYKPDVPAELFLELAKDLQYFPEYFNCAGSYHYLSSIRTEASKPQQSENVFLFSGFGGDQILNANSGVKEQRGHLSAPWLPMLSKEAKQMLLAGSQSEQVRLENHPSVCQPRITPHTKSCLKNLLCANTTEFIDHSYRQSAVYGVYRLHPLLDPAVTQTLISLGSSKASLKTALQALSKNPLLARKNADYSALAFNLLQQYLAQPSGKQVIYNFTLSFPQLFNQKALKLILNVKALRQRYAKELCQIYALALFQEHSGHAEQGLAKD